MLDRIGAYPIVDMSTELDQMVSAGTGNRANIPQGLEAVGDIEVVPLPDGKLLYALRVTRDCMQPEIMPGWTVRLDPEGHPEDGDIVVAVQDGEKAIVKWLEKDQAMQWLLPLNGEPILIDENIEIVGVVKDIVKPPPPKPRRRRLQRAPEGQKRLPNA